ncbi:MAG: NifU family protein [Gemmatimonadetes bacterium]|nr:NifU family protein [Gemmatimonadota bacterium]
MTDSITISAEPLDGTRYRFLVSEPVHAIGPGAYRFVSQADAAGVPVAEAVLGVPGIVEVVLSDRGVEVEKNPSFEWCDLEEQVQYAIGTAIAGMNAPAPRESQAMDDDMMYDVVAEVFRREINPSVASHGGAVELIDVQDATVVLRMQGGCQGCGMANVTLRQGIEGSLKRALPSLKGIQDVTDHSAGSNPYFASQSK